MSFPFSIFPKKEKVIEQQQYAPQEYYSPPPQMGNYGGYAGMNTQAVPNQDQGFLKWMFSFKEQTITPLRHQWRGEEMNENGQWIPSKYKTRMMNEIGVNWGITFIESFLSPVYVTSNYTEEMFSYVMLETTRSIYNSLTMRYKEFDLKKSDIDRVAIEIETKIQAILLGAREDGYRRFFQTTTHISENKNITQDEQQKTSFMNKMGFSKMSF